MDEGGEDLSNDVELSEKRKDARVATEYQGSFPNVFHHIPVEDVRHMVEEYADKHFVSKGYAVQYGIHGNPDQYHCHMLVSPRPWEGEKWGKKDLSLMYPAKAREKRNKHLRADYAAITNRYLQEAGYAFRVDPRSYKDQGLDRKPQKYIGPAVYLERAGIWTDIGAENKRIARDNRSMTGHVLTHRQAEREPETQRLERSLITRAMTSRRPIRRTTRPSFTTAAKLSRNSCSFSARRPCQFRITIRSGTTRLRIISR